MSEDAPLDPVRAHDFGEEHSESAKSGSDRRTQERRQTTGRIFLASVLIIAVLYVARPVFIPIALAILFSFLLGPFVTVLQRTFLRRTGAVVLSVGLGVALLSYGAYSFVVQINALAKEITSYSGNIEKKLRFLNARSGGSIAIVEKTLERLAETGQKTERADMKVRVLPERKSLADRYETVAPSLEFVASAFLVVVLVFFLLQDREKLRDKLLQLAGRANVTVTTQAIGETGHRISRYLLMIALLNLGFGIFIGLGLFFLKVPHVLLWAVLAGLLRFIPYVGAFISGVLPVFFALAIFPGWQIPLAVMALFLLADQILGGFVEPLVIGHRVGVSPIALLISTIFWGWLWGPVGLLLATPITVSLTVAGEFIPALRLFSILFGTETPLEDYLSFFNRLLLRDRAGASALADRYAEDHSIEGTFVDLFIPTLGFASEELGRKRITNANDHFIKDVVRELIVRMGDRNATVGKESQRIVAVSVARERLSLGTLMLTQLLRAEGYSVDYFTDLPEEELLMFINDSRGVAAFVSCSNPDHLEEGHRLLGILASSFPDLIVVAGGSAFAGSEEQTLKAGAHYIPATLETARDEFLRRVRDTRRRVPRTTA